MLTRLESSQKSLIDTSYSYRILISVDIWIQINKLIKTQKDKQLKLLQAQTNSSRDPLKKY